MFDGGKTRPNVTNLNYLFSSSHLRQNIAGSSLQEIYKFEMCAIFVEKYKGGNENLTTSSEQFEVSPRIKRCRAYDSVHGDVTCYQTS